ncbi:MAG: FHA domain-containing protein [Chloroflexi bacterium]|nr:FHA domain-containing protein [Chloroflexota bacterium]MBP7044642.1 FHA domain-containing protein [Chloroflexota bacterium]
MDPLIVLFLLRLLAAVLLLGFFGLFAWLIYQDVLLTKAVLAIQQQATGSLRVIKSESGEPALDTMYALRPLTSIGRAKSSTILLDDGYVSSEHVLITQRHGQWWLEDLGSRNGTLLNGAPLVETAVISAGDVITIGGTDLKVEL